MSCAHDGKLSRILHPMPHCDPPLEDVVTPDGSVAGNALWHAVAHFMGGSTEDQGEEEFNRLATAVFRFQFEANPLYRRWCQHLGWTTERASTLVHWSDIPTMPVEAFRWGAVATEGISEPGTPLVFRTSGTTGEKRGTHRVRTPHLYRVAATQGFSRAFGAPGPDGPVVLGLLPGYLERPDSSLVHMVRLLRSAGWAEEGGAADGGFYLDDLPGLFDAVEAIRMTGREVLLIGVTWALVDAAEAWRASGRSPLSEGVHIAVTGGMKGRREEWVAERVREALRSGFGCRAVAGEYGMTELLSQAWSKRRGVYTAPPWMRVRLRRTDDPLTEQKTGATGGVDVIDLANLGSCAFLSTQDLGRPSDPEIEAVGGFELLGRFDRSEVRGCNLLVD
jgi:hypothetical protein